MSVYGAVLPGGSPPGQDRWTATPHGIVVLDGATARAPEVPPAERYVDTLLDALTTRLAGRDELPEVIAEAIADAKSTLGITPGVGPSSTVALLRWTETTIEVAALGDNTIVLGLTSGGEVRLRDDRLSTVDPAARRTYHERLRHGHGYDDGHRDLLTTIQRSEVQARNTQDGYWIAEADPDAGHHAETMHLPHESVSWAVIATDGAQRVIDHLGLPWADVATSDDDELQALLDRLHRWETENDPNGQALPRAKPHDDKTLVVWQPNRA
ncbi:hypothetical protein [Pseudonocardia sp. HH130629-09]|uniref:hypothetical protein n=1 Tax=Pseudonocardia sp. HH130629-09 TaxID=1641402 RepID=UPI000B1048E0|nr:hypothetical protein [Pseudonocardia sp. HH130629-09]